MPDPFRTKSHLKAGDTVEDQYARLLADLDFDNIELLMGKPNVFNALGIAHYEIRHSNFLAWLLDPHQNHNLRNIFLSRFLRDLISDSRSSEISLIDIPDLLVENLVVYREWNSIDILLEFDTTVIALENKLLSKEHGNQLKRYKKTIEQHYSHKKKLFCYLTPFGDKASDSNYIEIGYDAIATHLEDILSLYQESLNVQVKIYIQDYIDNLRMKVMENGKANELAKKIYKNHKEILDFIFEHKPDNASHFAERMIQLLKSKGFDVNCSQNKGVVRFTTPTLSNLIPTYEFSNGWPKREAFLFEIDFLWVGNGRRIRFYPIVSNGDKELRNTLIQAIMTIDGAKAPKGKKWATFLHKEGKNFNIEEWSEKSEEDQDRFINEFIREIEPVVLKVEEALMECSAEIATYRHNRSVESSNEI